MTNYFELYELPVDFHPNKDAVKKKFYELSRRYHPDRFVQADDASRAEALRMAALNNDAYKTLSDADRTMAYVLKLHEMLEEEEKYSLPPAFLTEMMDLNEAVSDYEMDGDNQNARQQAHNALQEQLSEWQDSVAPLLRQYDGGNHSSELLKQIKDYYFRKKYLLRIQERIDRFAAR